MSNQPPRAPVWRQSRRRHAGVASLLAMLYLIIFSALAVGFYTAVTMASQVAHNDERAMNAQFATESGLKFVQYQLSRVRIPGTTPDSQVFEEVYRDLQAQQATAANMAGKSITRIGSTIHFPAPGEFVEVDGSGGRFRAEISDTASGALRVRITGRYQNAVMSRNVLMTFERVLASQTIFDYAIVSSGTVAMQGSAKVLSGSNQAIDGSVLSMSNASTGFSLSGSVSVAGDLYMTNQNGNVATTGKVSIGETEIPALQQDHIHRNAPAPEMPIVDTSIFKRFLTSTYQPGKTVYRNCLIPANTRPAPTFNKDVVIEGVLFIEYPNQVTFNGGCTVNGIIVVENGARPGPENSLTFLGNFNQYGFEKLPPSKEFPPDLLAMGGASILAPGFNVTFGGNAGSVGGTMVADSFKFFGNAGGDIAGTVIALGGKPLEISGSAQIRRSRPTVEVPAGLLFSKTYKPQQETYREVMGGTLAEAPAGSDTATANAHGRGPSDKSDRASDASAGKAKRGSERSRWYMIWL